MHPVHQNLRAVAPTSALPGLSAAAAAGAGMCAAGSAGRGPWSGAAA